MGLRIRADREMLVAFEPTAAEYRMESGKEICVEWIDGSDDEFVSLEGNSLVIWARSGGHVRAWEIGGAEIYIGPESGPKSQ